MILKEYEIATSFFVLELLFELESLMYKSTQMFFHTYSLSRISFNSLSDNFFSVVWLKSKEKSLNFLFDKIKSITSFSLSISNDV